MLLKFYEDKVRSKHLAKRCFLFVVFPPGNKFLVLFFNILRIWDVGGWPTLQNMPLHRKTVSFFFFLSTVRHYFTGWLSSWGGYASPSSHTAFPLTFQAESVVCPPRCHTSSFGFPTSCAHIQKREGSFAPLLMLEGFALSCLVFCFSHTPFETPTGCMSVFAQAAVTEFHSPGGVNSRNTSSHGSGGRESKVRAPA